MGKIKSALALKPLIENFKHKGKKIVFTNGCFDILHPGHLKILGLAKKKGDILIVGLNSDTSVQKIKVKGRPILNQEARAQILESLSVIDYVVFFDEKTPYNLIKKLKPDILVKGGDWNANQIVGSDLVKKVFRIKLCPNYSTSKIIAKIKRSS